MPAPIMLRTGEITILSDGRDRLFFLKYPMLCWLGPHLIVMMLQVNFYREIAKEKAGGAYNSVKVIFLTYNLGGFSL